MLVKGAPGGKQQESFLDADHDLHSSYCARLIRIYANVMLLTDSTLSVYPYKLIHPKYMKLFKCYCLFFRNQPPTPPRVKIEMWYLVLVGIHVYSVWNGPLCAIGRQTANRPGCAITACSVPWGRWNEMNGGHLILFGKYYSGGIEWLTVATFSLLQTLA